jgi:hypothetical protein
MKKHFYISLFFLTFISYPLLAQEKKKAPAGLGIEAGVGFNTMNMTVKAANGNDSAIALNHLWLQPCLRLHYDVKLKQMGEKNTLFLKTFIGYYTFGGKLKPDVNGNSVVVSLGSIEAGVGLTFDINHFFQVTPMIKGQYIFSASKRFIQTASRTPVDMKNNFTGFSSNAGLQARFKYKHFTLGLEGWLGLSDFHRSMVLSAKENNYRLLIGYEF